MDVNRNNISTSSARGFVDAPGDQEPDDLNLFLSLGSPQPRKQQPKPEQLPPNSPAIIFQPHQLLANHFVVPNASPSSWPLPINPHQQLLFQMPPPQHLPKPILPQPHKEDPQPSIGAVQSPRAQVQRGRVAGAGGSLSRRGKAQTITPPFPWATDRRAMVHSYAYLMANGMREITGEVQCKRCDTKYEMQYDLKEKFAELWEYIANTRCLMHDRAPNRWLNPALPDCRHCEQSNCVRLVPTKKKEINWLFLLLGQLLGCCKLSELKYFCKHTSNHRTGAKDRVLYSTYMGLCMQLDSKGPFHM
ncbi:uncharacterized protein LOC116207881 [Punica granatum]|uniref:Uncharacterized protein LOC116207881 n=1 Tax=Punica granatum TaxID=22663 RepID=A0A218XBM4_PUNGR|nr:uncharacterized protein LOC116207881 [Punica granatum]OWM82343.1 hypothetical protein CDL15_Pgr001917 [Punica granatum]